MKIPIVNEQDEVIQYKDTKDRKDNEITRITGVWIKDEEGNILLAQRSFSKKRDPGLWGPAVAGSVEEGETYESNAIKEAEEEIGLKDYHLMLGPKIRRHSSHEYFVQWFVCIVHRDYQFKKQDSEVEELKWFSKEELIKLLKEKPEIFLKNFNQYIELFINPQ